MDDELRKIKKIYGEKMAHLCRKLFPTLLEEPGKVLNALQKYFAPNHKIADDIEEHDHIEEFTKLIYITCMPTVNVDEIPLTITDKTPFELLREKGYTLYECKKESDIQEFKKYYDSAEKLCTFIGGQRLFSRHVFFAVMDGAEKIQREKYPCREDKYSLSVLSIQFSRGKDFNPPKIISRYNHGVENPDAVWGNDLNRLAPGLAYSFSKHYGFKLRVVDANTFFIDQMTYASDYRGVFYRWNYERNGIFYLNDNLILSHNGRLITDYADKSRFIFMDEFILDRKEKVIIGNKHSGFYRTTVMGKIVSTEFYSEKEQNLIIIHFDNGKFVKVWTYKNGLIKEYENNFARKIYANFLPYNRVIETITCKKAREVHGDFLIANNSLVTFDAPLIREIGFAFLPNNRTLTKFTAVNIKKIADHFMFHHPYYNRVLCLNVGHLTHEYPEVDPRVLRRRKTEQQYVPKTERHFAKVYKRLKMNKYYENLNYEIRQYFQILSPEFPEWLLDYINTPEMERISKISISCGTDYSSCFDIKYFYSNLDHSVRVALIIWNFTHDKKQTLAGLFHDIATPVFKHCIDFMNGDSEKQESTEERTTDFIKNSKEIMSLLERDGIKLEEVNDYKQYPIADNDTPKLSADRFEYTFSSGLSFYRIWDLATIRKMYNNVTVVKNEQWVDELAFKDQEICEEYISIISKIWPEWVSDKDRIVMQFLADMCKSMSVAGYLTVDDLYTLSESEVINRFITTKDEYLSESFMKFQKANTVHKSDASVDNTYCVNVTSKTRYVDPLVLTKDGIARISSVSEKAKKLINEYLELKKGGYYTYFDFDFKPYDGSERTRK